MAGYDRRSDYGYDRRDDRGGLGYGDRRDGRYDRRDDRYDDRRGRREDGWDDRGRYGARAQDRRGGYDERGRDRVYDDRGDGGRDYEDRGYEDRRGYSGREDGWRAGLPRRVQPACPVASRCGGCEWLAMPYDLQLDRKQNYIEELFGDIRCEVEPIIGMADPVQYRNKVQLPFAPGRPGRDGRPRVLWGIFERRTHDIVTCASCLVEDPAARPVIATVARLMEDIGIPPYDEREGTGLVRYALVRTARATGQLMLTLVCSDDRIPGEEELVNRLLDEHPELTSIVLNVNRERTSVILGDEECVLYGPGYIEDELCGCRFRISSSSFYQTNPVAAEDLYSLAVDMAGLRMSDRLGDAYCGTGTIGIVAAKRSGAALLGIERNADAVKDARANAELNGIDEAEFLQGDAGTLFGHMARQGEHLDAVFLDPPRAGATQAFLANLSRLSPTRVVYISCEPRTQRRDVAQLMHHGYRVARVRPVDMFPHTDHVENVVLLERAPTTGRSYARERREARERGRR